MMDDIINQNEDPMNPSSVTRRVQRVRHELRRRDVTVTRTQPLGANFVALAFAGEALADFVSDSFDDHVKFMFPDGLGDFVRRDYTPRSFDRARRELTIEFAIHGHGPASEWARHASVGESAVIGGPRGSMIIPTDYEWHLLAGDVTALPAISRRLEELPREARVSVVGLVADPADRREFESAARIDVQWVAGDEQLIEAVRAIDWPGGDTFAWCAGEAQTMARLRQVLLDEKAHPKEAMRVAAYWKRGATGFHEDLGR
jgi:NADPH-dependent ferric siderophore reductase